MPDLPRIPQRIKRTDLIIEVLCLILLLECWTYAVYSYNTLPSWFPIFGSSTDAGIDQKFEIWIFPLLATLIYISLSWVGSFPHKLRYKETVTRINARRIYRKKQRRIRIMKTLLVLCCGVALLVYIKVFGEG